MPNHNSELEARIRERGQAFFASIAGESPSVFDKGWWTGKILDWAMQHDQFKIDLFRFIDVLPCLGSPASLTKHIQEYFASGGGDVPPVLQWGASKAGFGGKIAGRLLGRAIRANTEGMAKTFIVGQNPKEAIKTLGKLRKNGFAFTVDLLGEASISRDEAFACRDKYLELLAALASEQKKWSPLDNDNADAKGASDLDWGSAPKINISIKPTALYSLADPKDFAGTVNAICERILPLAEKVRELNASLCIDMEAYQVKDITLAVYRRLKASAAFRDYPHLGIAMQAYLRDTDRDVEELLAWAKAEQVQISIRLVKGAYWDYETIKARQEGWEIPVYTVKHESDAAFERCAAKILAQHEHCYFACGSHNIRSIAAVMETAAALQVPAHRYEYQVLYGMAEPVRKGLQNIAGRVRLYAPYGELLPGMAYLVRRLLENTANESFLRQGFAEAADIDRLLVNPAAIASLPDNANDTLQGKGNTAADAKDAPPPFVNEPLADFTVAKIRAAYPAAIAEVRETCGKVIPLVIGGKEVLTDDRLVSVNPANPEEIIGEVCQAGVAQIEAAMTAAQAAFPAWRDTAPEARAAVLFRAAEIARRDLYKLAALQVLETGKQWDQAHADVAETIDFLEYYAREMIRLGTPRKVGDAPGEINEYFYQPKGIAAVIAPWNFPLAISCGMAAAAIVTGNCVLYKPAGSAAVIGAGLSRIFHEAGLPDGVFNFTPGRGSVIGDALVEHPAISLIAFTGSLEIGERIMMKAARIAPGQRNIKRVICELGGKNGIIIDDDADLDEAVPQVIYAAFGFQGQKCSACSRVIVHADIYDRFVTRLLAAAKSVSIGPAEEPAHSLGPVIDKVAQERILAAITLAESEGELLLKREVPEVGYYAPLTIVGGITPEHHTAQEEIFGPVLAVMKVADLDEAIKWANSTRYALTGALFSRSPANIAKVRQEFRVGNLYINRGSTGALVERQPFGGFAMSGVGSKAGGADYLLQFMDPRVVTENTMRRGFSPDLEVDK